MVERDEIRASCGPHDPDRERSLPLARTSDARAQVGTVAPLSPRATMKRKLEFHFERQWELYRLSVVENAGFRLQGRAPRRDRTRAPEAWFDRRLSTRAFGLLRVAEGWRRSEDLRAEGAILRGWAPQLLGSAR